MRMKFDCVGLSPQTLKAKSYLIRNLICFVLRPILRMLFCSDNCRSCHQYALHEMTLADITDSS